MSKNVPTSRKRRIALEEACVYREKWGVPNWQDTTVYLKEPADLLLDEWRWEFLRRDQGYRRAWLKRCGDTNIDSVNAAIFDLHGFIDPAISAKRLKEPLKFLRSEEGSQLHNLRGFISKYFPKDEAREIDYDFLTSRMRSLLCDKERAVFVFDITKPLSPQIRRAFASLEILQRNYRELIVGQLTKHGKKMPRRGASEEIPEICVRDVPPSPEHLRVLDARNEAVPFVDIGKVIYNVKDSDAAAIRGLREYRYAKMFWKLI